MRTRLDLLLAVVVLLVTIGTVAAFLDNRSEDRRADLRQQQIDQAAFSRAGCERSLTDRAEGIQRDMDLEEFLREAARARRADGQDRVADAYLAIAERAAVRERSARRRMLGADPSPQRIAATRAIACRRAYPIR